jgi:glycosyltransferase involved in cell wall biosynthesis
MIDSQLPLVAIATPVYNGERYLDDTMSCVQALDYPRLVHVILDNASTDATPDIISRYLNRRVPVIAARNAATIPMVANFNAVVRLVPKEAKYFRLLCADDFMTTDAISRKVEIAERYPDVDIVGCLERSDKLREENLPKDRELFEGSAIVRAYLRGENSVLSGTHFLIRRTHLDKTRSFYDEKLEAFTDADANLRVCMNGHLGFIHEGLATWRQHEGNTFKTVSQSNQHLAEWLSVVDRYGPQLLNKREFRTCRKAILRHYLRRLLIMRWRNGDRVGFRQHLNLLRANGDAVGWLDFADALAEWALSAMKKHRHSVGATQEHEHFPKSHNGA